MSERMARHSGIESISVDKESCGKKGREIRGRNKANSTSSMQGLRPVCKVCRLE